MFVSRKLFAIVVLALLSIVVVPASGDKCNMDPAAYPPSDGDKIPWATVNLDLPADQRWAELVKPQTNNIKALINTFLSVFPEERVQQFLDKIDSHEQSILSRFPEEYGAELNGIAQTTGIDIGELIIYQVAYELMGLCTSFVAQDTNGTTFHGRNLDFGLGMGFNRTGKTWLLPQKLRPLLVNVNFESGGNTLYTAVMYAGYIGVVTGVKAGAFSISMDTRFDNNYDQFLAHWFKDPTDTNSFLSFTIRHAFEHLTTYEDALALLSSTAMVSPGYAIMGGVAPQQGAVVTLAPNTTTVLDVWQIPDGYPTGKPFYVLETNYDHWEPAPFFDDRRTPACDCLDDLGSEGLTVASVYNVLHGIPNRNQLTTYHSIMTVQTGAVESYLAYCWPQEEAECKTAPW